MSQKKQLSILEFSRMTGIKRENLRYYDRIGLLSPETRGENKYRYYSRHQLSTAYLISSLRGLGVGIEDIKQYETQRTAANTLTLFAQQDARIQAEIQQLRETRMIMQMRSDMIQEALDHKENPLFLEEKEQETIFLCPASRAQMDQDEYDIFSYEYAEANGVNLGFPQGTMLARGQIESDHIMPSDRYYFKVKTGGNAYKPAGCYAVVYGWCDIWKTDPLYQQLLNYIEEQGLRICGNTYEEYPLGDSEVRELDQYYIRVEIPVVAP